MHEVSGGRFRLNANPLGVGVRLGDLGRLELRLALDAQRVLTLSLRLRHRGGVLRFALLEVTSLVVDGLLRRQLRLARSPLLVRRHDVGIGLRLDRGLSTPRLRDLLAVAALRPPQPALVGDAVRRAETLLDEGAVRTRAGGLLASERERDEEGGEQPIRGQGHGVFLCAR